jgi:hypothetical protein
MSQQLDVVLKLREIELRRVLMAWEAAKQAWEAESLALRQAIEKSERAQRNYAQQTLEYRHRAERGGVTALALLSAMSNCERLKKRLQDLLIAVEDQEGNLSMAAGKVEDAVVQVRKSSQKIESLKELINDAQIAQDRLTEIYLEQDVDEQATLQAAKSRNALA